MATESTEEHGKIFLLLTLLNLFFRVFPCASVAITGFIFPWIPWIPWPLLVFFTSYFLLSPRFRGHN